MKYNIKRAWETALETLTDSYSNIKFIASGSAASVLLKGARESGAGRFTDLTLAPLTFYEYVHMLGHDESALEPIEQANRLFLDYVNFGGYPELVSNSIVRDNPKQFIQRDIVDKVLLNKIVVTSKTEKGAKYMDNVELSFIPTALFAYKIGKESFSK